MPTRKPSLKCAKHLREIQDQIEWRDIFSQWIGNINAVKVNHSQIYIQIKSNCNQIPLCFCVCETWQADSKLMLLLFSHSVMCSSLKPYGLQHIRTTCRSPTPRVYSKSCPLSQWCHPTISSSVIPFSSCLQSFPASGSLPVSRSSHQVAKVLEFQLQHQSFQWIFRTDFI